MSAHEVFDWSLGDDHVMIGRRKSAKFRMNDDLCDDFIVFLDDWNQCERFLNDAYMLKLKQLSIRYFKNILISTFDSSYLY